MQEDDFKDSNNGLVKYCRAVMRNNQQVHVQIHRFYTIISAGPYLLRPSIVAIFRKGFFDGILHGSLKQDGHNRWLKHVGGYFDYNIKDLHNYLSTCWLFLIRNHKYMITNHLKLLSGAQENEISRWKYPERETGLQSINIKYKSHGMYEINNSISIVNSFIKTHCISCPSSYFLCSVLTTFNHK
jgi:hypothetical protein